MTLAEMTAKLDAAHKEVKALCHGKRWRMSIPAQPESDSDLVITAALSVADDLVARLLATALDAGPASLPEKTTTLPIPDEVERVVPHGPDVNYAIKALDAAALWTPESMHTLADTLERAPHLAICEAQYLRGIANRLQASLPDTPQETPDPIDVNPTAERWGWTRLNFPPGDAR